jgi:retron-type reverse transcriptase
MQLELFSPPSIGLSDLFEAYHACRKNKRKTMNAAAFEVDHESNLVALWKQINTGSYYPGRSLAFVVDKPVKREIFAAEFRDRVVHHLIINKINRLLEREFIYDSYACRVGKGTHMGIRRLDRFMRRCSANHTRDAYVLKMDIKGFFMSIDRGLLFERLRAFLHLHYTETDRDLIIDLCRRVITHDPASDCRIRGNRRAWDGLPQDKSLFHARYGCGLPIGNLTSQVFANFYLNPFDHFVKKTLGIRYYGRYVDDFVIVHESRDFLKGLVPVIRDFLKRELSLTLHPKKIYLQHVRHGVVYLGAVIKPHRVTVTGRTKRNFAERLAAQNRISENHRPDREEKSRFRACVNSYLGILSHYATYRLRRAALDTMNHWWRRLFTAGGDLKKITARRGRITVEVPPMRYRDVILDRLRQHESFLRWFSGNRRIGCPFPDR